MNIEEIKCRLYQIDLELSDLYFSKMTGTFDIFGNKKRDLSEEWVFLSRQLYKGCSSCRSQ